MDKSNGIALAYLTALVSGISVFANSFGVVTMDATAYTLVKNVAVAAIIAAIAVSIGAWREILALNRKQVLMLLFVGVVGGGAAFALYFNGLAATGGAVGSFLYRLLFVFAVVIAVGALKERFDWRIGAGVLAVLAGNYLLLGDAALSLTGGVLLVLAATALWACEYAVSKKALEGLSATTLVAARMGIGAIVLLGILALQGKIGALGAVPAASIGWIALAVGFLVLFTTLWYSALKRTTLISATAALALGGPVSALLSLAFAGKALAPVSVPGVPELPLPFPGGEGGTVTFSSGPLPMGTSFPSLFGCPEGGAGGFCVPFPADGCAGACFSGAACCPAQPRSKSKATAKTANIHFMETASRTGFCGN